MKTEGGLFGPLIAGML